MTKRDRVPLIIGIGVASCGVQYATVGRPPLPWRFAIVGVEPFSCCGVRQYPMVVMVPVAVLVLMFKIVVGVAAMDADVDAAHGEVALMGRTTTEGRGI